jgi:hypothetical protein
MTYDSARAIFPILPLPPEPDTAVLRGASSVHPRAGGRRSRTFRRAILESRSDVASIATSAQARRTWSRCFGA